MIDEHLNAAAVAHESMFTERSRAKWDAAGKHANDARTQIRAAHALDPEHESPSWDFVSVELLKLIRG